MLTLVRNRGELAEGWYDPVTLRKAIDAFTKPFSSTKILGGRRPSPVYLHQKQEMPDGSGSSDDGDIGPALPHQQGINLSNDFRSGPTIPSLQDPELRRGKFQLPFTKACGCRELAKLEV